jgi:hypothetical protein
MTLTLLLLLRLLWIQNLWLKNMLMMITFNNDCIWPHVECKCVECNTVSPCDNFSSISSFSNFSIFDSFISSYCDYSSFPPNLSYSNTKSSIYDDECVHEFVKEEVDSLKNETTPTRQLFEVHGHFLSFEEKMNRVNLIRELEVL